MFIFTYQWTHWRGVVLSCSSSAGACWKMKKEVDVNDFLDVENTSADTAGMWRGRGIVHLRLVSLMLMLLHVMCVLPATLVPRLMALVPSCNGTDQSPAGALVCNDALSSQPSSQPSMQPSGQPSSQPSMQPSGQSSMQPPGQLSSQPSMQPSGQPTAYPSGQPTRQPSMQPSDQSTILLSMHHG